MRVKNRLRIIIAVIIVTAVVICLSLFLSLHRINLANNSTKIASEMITEMLERISFRNDYIRTDNERAKEQWFAKHAEIGRGLKEAAESMRDGEDGRTIAALRENQESIGKIFQDIVANREKSSLKPGAVDLAREVEERLLSQLNMRVYEEVSHGRKLLESSSKERDSVLRQVTAEIISLLALLIGLSLTISLKMGRVITDRIARLRKGAAVIGGGDLEYRIDLKGDDEFSELSDAFNEMSEKLHRTYGELENRIEERKEAEEELRLSYGRLQTFFDHRIGGIGIVIANAKGEILQANDYYLTILGYTREELQTGQVDWRRLTPPEWLPADEKALVQLKEQGVCDTYEKEYARRDDSRVPVLITNAMMPGESGDILAFVLDITERKLADEALQKSDSRLKVTIENLREGVIIATEGGEVIYWNQSAQAMHGFTTPDEGIGPLKETPNTFDLIMPDSGRVLPFDEWPMPRIIRGENVRDFELRLRRPDQGWERFVSYSGAMMETTSGERLVFLSVHDLTERKRAEEEIKKSLHEKEVLLKEIHHRVKNNMQVISSLVSLQADGSKDETVRDVLKDITYRVRSMALVHEKLYQSTDLAHIDFAEYCRSLLNYLWHAHGDAAASVRLTFDLKPVSLPVDIAVPCGLILNELASNAIKHAFAGRGEGEVTVSLHADAEGQIRLCVRDNGGGLPAGLDWRQTKSLGLRLVQMLSRQIDATVEVSGGDGTAFELIFRLKDNSNESVSRGVAESAEKFKSLATMIIEPAR